MLDNGMDIESNIDFEVCRILVSLLALASLVGLWFVHSDEPIHNRGNDEITVAKTLYVYGGNYGVGKSKRGRDEEKTSSESYRANVINVINPFLPYVAASPYARDLGRTSPSVEALMSHGAIKRSARSTFSAFMSDSIDGLLNKPYTKRWIRYGT